MTLSLLSALTVILFALLLIIISVLFIRLLRRFKREKHLRPREAAENNVDVAVYAYDPDISGLDDVRAKHIGAYRDTGVITGIEDDCRVFQERFTQTKDNDRELGLIIRSAAEVKRLTDKTIVYYFKRIKPLSIKSGSIRVLYNCISQGLDNNRPVVLRMTKSAAGDNEA